jgi:hypothetical protein
MHTPHRLSLALLFTLPVSASPAQTPAWRAQRPPIIAVAVRASLYRVQPTSDQQAKIRALVTEQRPQLVAVRDSMKPWATKLRTARQQNDTAGARTARVELRRGRRAIAGITRQTLLQVRPMLTAPQQAQFDVNLKRVTPALIRFVRRGQRPG